MKKSAEIFTITKYQKKVLNAFILVNLLGSIFRTSKKLYRELVLEEFKYAVKEK